MKPYFFAPAPALAAVHRLVPYLGCKLGVELAPAPAGGAVPVSKEKASAVKHWLEGAP